MSSFLERIEKLSPKQLALLAVELQNRLEASERKQREPIAIVGIGCRIPGAENGPEGFWRLLHEGRDAISQPPPDRWDAAAYYSADPDAPGRTATLWGSFLPAVDYFDAAHFGISRREAVSIDPQQRILMEVCWEALEHAGYSPRSLGGSATGVYVGLSTLDYHGMLLERGEESLDAYFATGTSASIAAGRISYSLGLQGPSMAIDTACSSSLVSVHLACQALRAGDCRLALAGGVNLILWPEVTIALSKAHMMTPDGRCKAFDSQADGFVRGEGAGIVILKRLSEALADRDNVLAVVRGSAVNQDGRSSGITAPNGAAQEMAIRQALSNAGVSPDEIGYVESHGTGTALGDPIEAHALAGVFGRGRAADNPLTLGSVKTNIGHLEAAAGVAGLIKVVLALQNGRIPAHLHFHQMNPHIDWGGLPVRIPVAGAPWPRDSKRRIAGVSSFGFSGTNAHVIVEESPLFERYRLDQERPVHILALTACSQGALTRLAGSYAEALGRTEYDLGDFCFTANAGRAQFDHRAVYCGATRAEMQQALGPPIAPGLKSCTPEVAFLFSGQGAQYAGMGKELYATQPVFRQAIEQCATLLKAELEEPLLEVLWGSAVHRLDLTANTQPALFALEYALTELWKSWGVLPSAVLGHSVGEYVAACIAGVYSLDDGLKLMAARARLMQTVAGQGAMAAVWAPETQVREALRGLEERVSIAALNAPSNLVISGYSAELAVAEERLRISGARVQRLAVSHGFHSPQMREMETAFAAVAGGFHYAAPGVRWISSVTGQEMSRDEIADAHYWVRQVQRPVRFERAMATLCDLGYRTFVEIGPGSTLTALGRQCIPADESLWAGSLRKGCPEWQQMLESLGRLFVHGADVDWAGFDQPYRRRRVSLPTYPFERQRYWMETDGASRTPQSRQRAQAKPTVPPIAAEAPHDWFYKLAWQAKPLRIGSQLADNAASLADPLKTAGNRTTWLIIPDTRGFALALLDRLKEIGAETFLADPAQPFEAYLRKADYDYVVHLSALDSPDSDDASLQGLAASQAEVMSSALGIAQALLVTGSRARLWFLTRGSQPASSLQGRLNVAQAPVWGLAKTIGLEHPEIWGGAIDLDPCEAAEKCAARVASAILENDGEDQIAFRQGERRVARLVRLEPPCVPAIQFRADGLYLITGGLGGLGRRLASWMVERGARRVVLAGRTSLPDRSQWDGIPAGSPNGRKIAAVRHLEQLGAEVTVASTDICDPKQVAALFTTFDPNELRGVMHLAGSLDAAAVKDMTKEGLATVLAPKTIGTWLLHDLTSRLPLDFFVMFSSWASVLGARELGHYAAANQFMDTLAHYRRDLGMPALSVNWATWNEIGVGYGQVRLESAASGLTPMPSELALDALGRAMASGESQVAIAAVNWKVLKDIYQTRRHRPLLELVTGVPVEKPVTTGPASTLLDCLTRATPGEWPELVTAAVRREAAAVLLLRPDELATDQGLFEIGMDSIMAVELKGRLESLIGVPLSPTLIFSHPTVRALAEYVAEELRSLLPSEAVPVDPQPEASELDLATMLVEAMQEIQ